MTKETKQKVLEGLRAPGNRGSILMLAKRRGCTPTWINRVLAGDDQDDELVLLASELVLELEQKRLEKEREALNNLNQVSRIKASLVTA